MSNPIELIKKGILYADFNLVIDAYKLLTGEDLSVTEEIELVSKPKRGRPKTSSKSKNIVKKDIIVSPAKKRKSKKNNILDISDLKDNMTLYEEIKKFGIPRLRGQRGTQKLVTGRPSKSELDTEKKLEKYFGKSEPEKTERNRQKFKMVKVKCDDCGKICEIHPVDAHPGYLCKGCRE